MQKSIIDAFDQFENRFAFNAQNLLCQLNTEARRLMMQGAPLVHDLPGRAGWELRLVIQGGLRILDRLDAMQGRNLYQRVKLSKLDLPFMAWRTLWM